MNVMNIIAARRGHALDWQIMWSFSTRDNCLDSMSMMRLIKTQSLDLDEIFMHLLNKSRMKTEGGQ